MENKFIVKKTEAQIKAEEEAQKREKAIRKALRKEDRMAAQEAMSERIRELRYEKFGKRGGQLMAAEAAEVRPSEWCRYENGKNKLNRSTIYNIARVLGVDFEFIAYGQKLPRREIAHAAKPHELPLLGEVSDYAFDSESRDNGFVKFDPDDRESGMVSLKIGTGVVYVRDRCMAPWLCPGQRLIIHPDSVEPKAGDLVAVWVRRRRDGRLSMQVRRYNDKSNEENVVLDPIQNMMTMAANPMAEGPVTYSRGQIQAIRVIAGIWF